MKLELDRVVVSGSPRELGRGQGEALRERIQRFVAMRERSARGYFAERGRTGYEQLVDVARESMDVFARWDPAGHDEHVGIAEGADVDPARLYMTTQMTDMRDAVLLAAPSGPQLTKVDGASRSEGCTSVLVPAPHAVGAAALAGQTWDLNPPDVEYVVAIRRRPTDGPETWSVTCVGCLTLVGLNDRGLAVGTTNVKTYGSRPGVGYLGLLHRAIRATSVAEARAALVSAPCAAAHTYWLAGDDGMLEIELSPNGAYERRPDAPLARTNHCLAPFHVGIEGEAPSASSKARLTRAAELLRETPLSADDLVALFSDRRDGVDSINRYPEDDQGTATNAVFVATPADRRARACRGPADRGAWVELRFD